MTYQQAIDYIHGTLKFGSKLGLHNIGTLLGLMGNPQKKLRFVHVAGTNGKGSTVSFISSILVCSGYKTGIFTSPFIQRFTERISINDSEIEEEALARITGMVRGCIEKMLEMGENHPTEFEIITAIAFQYFAECKCDVVVLEVGLGGRFDSTNIIDMPDLAVITTISYDHTDRLGKTLGEIAFEKAGIIKPGCDVLVYPQSPEPGSVIDAACAERNACCRKADFSSLKLNSYNLDGQQFDFRNYRSLVTSLLGEHQLRNAALAVEAAELLAGKGYSITSASIRQGLFEAKWPGRFEILHRNPVFIIDGAHNLQGVQVLRDTIFQYFPNGKITAILGVLRDKDYFSIMETILPYCREVYTVTPASDRALGAKELADAAKTYCNIVHISDTIENAVRTCLQNAQADEVVCAFGSLYFIGAVRDIFSKK